MSKKISKEELRYLVEQKVDEAWYNNLDDFYHGVGKCATIGALGAGSLMGGAYCLDKGLENQEHYEQSLNKDASNLNPYSNYEKWCEDHGLNPDDDSSFESFEDYNKGLEESNIRHIVRRAIVENYVRKSLKKYLSESYLYTDDIDTSDLRVYVEPYNEDGYCEWEATCDNGWYTFRGTYASGDCELEDIIEGHSGHGVQHNVDDKTRDWFYDNLYDRVTAKIESQQNAMNEGLGNWFNAAVDGVGNMGKYSKGPSNSKLTNFVKNVQGRKKYYDDMDSSEFAYQNGYGNSAINDYRKSRMKQHRMSQRGDTPTQGQMGQHYQTMHNFKDAQQKADSARRNRMIRQKEGM